MISTELDSRRAAAPDERATLFPTGGACSFLATAVRLQRLDELLDNDSPGTYLTWSRPRSSALTGVLPPFDEPSECGRCQVAWAPGRRWATGSGEWHPTWSTQTGQAAWYTSSRCHSRNSRCGRSAERSGSAMGCPARA